MALAVNMRAYLATSSATAHKRHLQTIKGNWASSSNYVRSVTIKASDEPSPEAARAIDKVLMLPEPPTE